MAFLRHRARSPYIIIKHRCLETDKWVEESTKLRWENPKDVRKAQKKADAYSARERLAKPISGDDFSGWVPAFLSEHYARASSRDRAEYAWLPISDWLRERKLKQPREIRYEHAGDYMKWRKEFVTHNTARLEVKFFAFLLTEAVRRGMIDRNPFLEFKVEKAPQKEKPELTDDMIAAARKEFQKVVAREPNKEWMGITFEILIATGCRFQEASIPMERIDIAGCTAIFEDSKRKPSDPKKFFTVDLDPAFAEYLRALPPRDRTTPPLTKAMNREFNRVLKRATDGATSHSCRVTFISRCHAAGLTESEVMALVNHSNRLVHRIYTRKNLTRIREARRRVTIPPPLV